MNTYVLYVQLVLGLFYCTLSHLTYRTCFFFAYLFFLITTIRGEYLRCLFITWCASETVYPVSWHNITGDTIPPIDNSISEIKFMYITFKVKLLSLENLRILS